jgi:hypothetical protein
MVSWTIEVCSEQVKFEGSVLLSQDLDARCPDSSVLGLKAIVGASNVSVSSETPVPLVPDENS